MEPQNSTPKAVEDFRQALDKLMSLKCFKFVVSELDKTSQLNSQVLELENQLKTMNSKHAKRIEEMTSDHESANLVFLETHRKAFDLASGEYSSLQNTVKGLEVKLLQSKELHDKQSNQLQDLNLKIEAMSLKLKEKDRTMVQLEAQSKEAIDSAHRKDEQIRKLEIQLEAQKIRSSQLEKSYAGLEKDKISADRHLQSATKELSKIKAFTSEIHREEPKTEVLERLYSSLYKVAMEFSHEDLADNVVGNGRGRALKNFVGDAKLGPSIPVVLSNSPQAKFIRGVMLLASLAHRLCTRVFQPFYHSDDPSLRWILANESAANAEKELLCRAILVSLEPDEQVEYSKDIISDITKEMMDLANRLVPDQKAHDFSDQLKPIVEDALKIWKHMQRCRARVVADINIKGTPSWHWRAVEPYSKNSYGKEEKEATNKMILAVFPRIYVVAEDGHKPLFPGVVLNKWQLRSIENEIEASNLASGPNDTPRRKMSMRGEANNENGEHSFLVSG